MLCCCRDKLDIAQDSSHPSQAKKLSATQTDSEKEKAFSEAVTAHPSPAVTPVTKQPDKVAVPAAAVPSLSPPAEDSVPVQPSSHPAAQVGQLSENKPVERPRTVEESVKRSVEETVKRTEASSVDTTPKSNVSVVNVKGPPSPVAPVSRGVLSAADQALLSQIESLSQTVGKAAEKGEVQGREGCRVYATQLSVLTSQVRKEAGNMSESALQNAVARLESVATRLEGLAGKSTGGSAGDAGPTAAFVAAFDGLLSSTFAKFISLSSSIGGDVQTQANLVKDAFQAERQFLVMASKSKAPAAAAMGPVVQPVAQKLTAVQEFREQNRRSAMFNHLSAISESIAALGWITVTPAPGPYVKEMKDAGMFYTNRVLKDHKEKDGGQVHVDWVKAWLGTLTELHDYIKQNHTTGVSWNPTRGRKKENKKGLREPFKGPIKLPVDEGVSSSVGDATS
ncbi:hypothetical protein ACOMHN_059230 [Nucella lapillus]